MQNVLLTSGLFGLMAGWLLPGHYPPWVSYQQQWLSAFGASLLALAAVVGAPARRVRWPALALFFVALATVPLLQVLLGQLRFVSDGILPAAYLAAFGLSIATGAMLAEQLQLHWVDALAAAIGTAASISVVIALLQWLQLSESIFIAEMPVGGRPFGNVAQPNHLATLLCLGVTCVLWGYERRSLSGLTSAVVIAWLGWGIVTTQSRTAWLFVAVLVVWWTLMRRRMKLRLGPKAVAAAVVLFMLAIASWTPLNDFLLLSTEALTERLQPGLRGLHWATLLDAVGRAPWLGYGWLQVTLAQETSALSHPASHEMLQDSHNVVIDLMIWAGIPLATLVVAAVTGWLAVGVWRCRERSVWVLLAAVAAILTHGLLEYPLDYTYFLLPLGLLMGSVEGLSGGRRLPPWPRWTFAAPLVAIGVLLCWIGRECIELEASSRQLRFYVMGIGTDQVAAVPPPGVVLLDAPREYHRFWLTPAREGMSAKELDWMRDVSQRNAFPPAMLRYAMAAGLNGREQEAARTLALLCNLHPEKRCEEGRDSWAAAQEQHPQLRGIQMPPKTSTPAAPHQAVAALPPA